MSSYIHDERWVYECGDHSELKQLSEIVLLGYDHYNKAEQLSNHIHENAYEFVYIEQGAVSWDVNGETYHMHAQQIFHTRPGELHRASFDYIGPCKMWWMIIRDPQHAGSWFSLGKEDREQFSQVLRHLPRIISTNKVVAESFRSLRKLIEQPGAMLLEYQVRHHVLEVFLHLMHSSSASLQSPDIHDFSIELAKRIEMNPALRLSTRQLAAELGLSESHFYRVFRETNGQSPALYMERVRMGCACRLLLQSSLSITNIAHDLGFKTSQHFATVFKKYIGMTPREWRSQENK
ncbi:AraC family transcriptional regulator [Paenibacillus sp. KQZ6P-2]|uniref:AraC family transcriptional regulator n=1 Tax=Paenibacillus mangrovi TaxID=2931978 RepID=A0A9X1WR95_9BACL|nr:AraC family transcriptional regulator [Paenibacillus mangrovi]MCJ8013583.1 AraC family transcriptional regulator [Paenibacillus mangrovi]